MRDKLDASSKCGDFGCCVIFLQSCYELSVLLRRTCCNIVNLQRTTAANFLRIKTVMCVISLSIDFKDKQFLDFTMKRS